jgi:hypothetical protein
VCIALQVLESKGSFDPFHNISSQKHNFQVKNGNMSNGADTSEVDSKVMLSTEVEETATASSLQLQTAASSDESRPSFSERWTRTINSFHEPYLKHVLHPTTQFGKKGIMAWYPSCACIDAVCTVLDVSIMSSLCVCSFAHGLFSYSSF